MKLILIILSILVQLLESCKPANNKPFSEKDFTEIYRDSLKIKFPTATYTIKKDLEIHVKYDTLELIHYLDNAYSSYKAEPDSLSSVLNMYLKSAADLYKKEEPIKKDKIIPAIKDLGYIDEITLTLSRDTFSKAPPSFVYEKYNDKLIILYGEDGENGIHYFTQDQFNQLGLNKDSLSTVAIRNLNSLLPEIQRNGGEDVFMLTAGGNYEASLILLKDIWTKENIPIDGEIVIAIPTRDLLLVTGTKNTEGIKKIKSMAQEAWSTGNYRLVPDLFIWNGKKFEPYK